MTSEDNKMNEPGASSVTGKKNNYRSGYNKKGAPSIRSAHENQFNELRGKIFAYGVQGQKEAFIKAKKAVAEFLGKTSDAGKELYTAMQTGVEPTFKKEPEDPGANATPA
jgi:hypothetical protein